MHDALVLRPGPVVLAGYETSSKPLADVRGDKGQLEQSQVLTELQSMLYAEGAHGSRRRVLLVLQGMDTSGKGGVTNHVVGSVQPIGVQYAAFKKPTEEELAHDFLWRVRQRLPGPGVIGVFDRSHYEDVLVPRVHRTLTDAELELRYAAINEFEREITAAGTTVVKCFLHISYETQRERLLARVDDPRKRWKFDEADLAERALWSHYTLAYEAVLERCHTDVAPWFVVPADSKKYRNWAVGQLLRETLEAMDLHYPQPALDWNEIRELLTSEAPRPSVGTQEQGDGQGGE
jgi:PPK2 family polyphosphate:nucleotide phosphotransferase